MNQLLTRVVQKSHRRRHVRQLRIYTFLKILRAEHGAANKKKAVDAALRAMKAIKHIRETRLCDFFTPAEISQSWEKAITLMIQSYTEHNTSVAADGGVTCHICMDNVGDFLLVHGGSAHGGVCGACALRIILEGHKCPFCARSVKMICVRGSVENKKNLRIFDM